MPFIFSFDCESLAAQLAIQLAKKFSLHYVIFKNNSKQVIQSLHRRMKDGPWEISNVIFGCKHILKSLPVWNASAVTRMSNWLPIT
ncbi:hypothetical protein PanWU01x14_076220 [Parasponia andersonii]|uniref:RNase H type-1 domain-containing protein n=1 Tax=Parasponia andersonii TaxID=3476 RepID=A0A2P5DCA5_PARAD|nr:hypothetical protein PanWU01x14_076220 [Parasponia andersonii]